MDIQRITACFTALSAAIPEPKTELHYRSPFELLVAVLLSAQSTDRAVNMATPSLFAAAPTPAAMVRLGEAGIKTHIRHLGLFNNKARHLYALAQLLITRHGGEVPGDRESLEALPGVGRKTANVIMNTLFGAPTIAVDTHIFRVANRTGIAPGKTPLAVEKALLRAVPDAFRQDAHHLLILHGRYTCMARRPHCGRCPLFSCCAWPEKQQWAEHR